MKTETTGRNPNPNKNFFWLTRFSPKDQEESYDYIFETRQEMRNDFAYIKATCFPILSRDEFKMYKVEEKKTPRGTLYEVFTPTS